MLVVYLTFSAYLTLARAITSVNFDSIKNEELTFNKTFTKLCIKKSVIECADECLRQRDCFVASYNEAKFKCMIDTSGSWIPNSKTSSNAVLMKMPLEDIPQADPPKDCYDLQQYCSTCVSGQYTIHVEGTSGVLVYCDMTTAGGGWTVIQRRTDGSVDFHKNWNEYELGFGDVTKEHWLGNENIHLLTSQRQYQLFIEIEEWTPESKQMYYSSFQLGNGASNYKLSIGSYTGSIGDSLRIHDQQPFSTKDRDNDNCVDACAQGTGGWWFSCCYESNLNGIYIQGGGEQEKACSWLSFKGLKYSMKSTVMMVKPNI